MIFVYSFMSCFSVRVPDRNLVTNPCSFFFFNFFSLDERCLSYYLILETGIVSIVFLGVGLS